jgi:hypothetical protein
LAGKIDESALASSHAFPGRGNATGLAFSGTLQTSSWQRSDSRITDLAN